MLANKIKPEEIPIKQPGVVSYTVPTIQNTTSMYGPADGKKRILFFITIPVMIFCAANNDFLGKLTYQSLPQQSFLSMLWIAWLLSFGSFAICSLGIILSWSKGTELQKLKESNNEIYVSFFIAGCCHVWMNCCRYIALLFLPAPVVTILKSGSQLIFSALIRYLYELKILNKTQLIGITLACFGLCLVIVPVYVNGKTTSVVAHVVGILLLLSIGLIGAVRNQYEQSFVRMRFKSNFVVGVRSLNSVIVTGILGIVMYFIPQIPNTLPIIGYYPYFVLFFAFFLLAIFLKEYAQMKLIKLSSAVTRNLFMQCVPSVTWILSLLLHYIVLDVTGNPNYGEEWGNWWSLFRVCGFIIVAIGAYIYIRHKTIDSKSNMSKENISLISM
eukprot:401405_1